MAIFFRKEKQIYDILCNSNEVSSFLMKFYKKRQCLQSIEDKLEHMHTDRPDINLEFSNRSVGQLLELNKMIEQQEIILDSVLTLFEYLKRIAKEYKMKKKDIVAAYYNTDKLENVLIKLNEAVSYLRLLRITFYKQKNSTKILIEKMLLLKKEITNNNQNESHPILQAIELEMDTLKDLFSKQENKDILRGEEGIYEVILRDMKKEDSHVKQIASAIVDFKDIRLDMIKEKGNSAGQIFGMIAGVAIASFLIYKLFTSPSSEDTKLLSQLQSTTSVGEQTFYKLANKYEGFEQGFQAIVGILLGTGMTFVSLFSFLNKKTQLNLYRE
ncbi:MAG: hypothetical protein WC755_07855 [Candidatus Woesearchaeota archaeon]|jgi:hypothetical protein